MVFFGFCAKTLNNLFKENREYFGGGRQTVIFSAEEENKLTDYVTERMFLGCKLDFHQLCSTIQELIGMLRVVNPDRQFSTKWDPEESYVWRFMKRHKLVFWRTMALSTARAMLTPVDPDNWYSDVNKKFFTNPKFSACFKDDKRIYNQDETPLTSGNEHLRYGRL